MHNLGPSMLVILKPIKQRLYMISILLLEEIELTLLSIHTCRHDGGSDKLVGMQVNYRHVAV